MNKYEVQSMGMVFIIKCNTFIAAEKGYYRFANSETGEEWFFPINMTFVKSI